MSGLHQLLHSADDQGVITGEHDPQALATAEAAHWVVAIAPGVRLITVEGIEVRECMS